MTILRFSCGIKDYEKWLKQPSFVPDEMHRATDIENTQRKSHFQVNGFSYRIMHEIWKGDDQYINDVVKYLEDHSFEIKKLHEQLDILDSELEIMLYAKSELGQICSRHNLPLQLLKVCADLSLAINLVIYPMG